MEENNRSYGLCPTQLDGYTEDGRPFYFRSRHGEWRLEVGPLGAPANICAWGSYKHLVAHGDRDVNDPDEVDAIVTEAFGEGWRQATREEQMFNTKCHKCGKTYRTLGGNICSDCLTALIKGE